MAQPRKTGFPLTTHRVFGRTVSDMRNTLLTASVFVGNTYGKAPMRRLDRIIHALDRLRCRLDDLVYQEYSTVPHVTRLYYPLAVQSPSQRIGSLDAVCRLMANHGSVMRVLSDLLLAHYSVNVGDTALKIARELTYQADELPFVVGPPKHQRKVA